MMRQEFSVCALKPPTKTQLSSGHHFRQFKP
jgi:hypothetical protein